MDDEEVLAVILVTAAAFLLLLAVITLCIIISCTGHNKKRKSSSEIPKASRITHSSYNYGQEKDVIYVANQNKRETNEETASHIESHKADWPTNYNRYAISRSYAFPKKGEVSYYDNQSYPNSNTGTSSHEISHKTFSEEVFSGVNNLPYSATEEPTHNREIGSHTATRQPNGNGIWKQRPVSTSTTSHHSLDGHSITSASTASHPRNYSHLPEQKSYYSTFKTHHVYISPSAQMSTHEREQPTSQRIPSQQEKINSTHNIPLQKEKLYSHELNPSGQKPDHSKDIVVYKGQSPDVDSYSAFWDNRELKQTDLFLQLLNRGITDVYLCGLAFDFCVAYSAEDAALLGFKTFVFEDACRAVDFQSKNETKKKFGNLGIKLVQSSEAVSN